MCLHSHLAKLAVSHDISKQTQIDQWKNSNEFILQHMHSINFLNIKNKTIDGHISNNITWLIMKVKLSEHFLAFHLCDCLKSCLYCSQAYYVATINMKYCTISATSDHAICVVILRLLLVVCPKRLLMMINVPLPLALSEWPCSTEHYASYY